MKKLILFGAAIMIAFGASAQMSLVKDLAKKAASENPMELVDVLTKIEPALENVESAGDVLTWYTAGTQKIIKIQLIHSKMHLNLEPRKIHHSSSKSNQVYQFVEQKS